MTFGSLFAGVGGFDLGFERAGLRCAWQVEINAAARGVLAHRWPDVPKHADVRDVGSVELAPVDVVCGGFPCQDLSVAGKRAGLAGRRSGLFYQMTRIVDELQPRYVVWENVPGLLTSDGGRDFARVLVEMERVGYVGGWRVLDTQHFGVPQRRRRVFGVFARRDLGVERCAEILALREGVRGHSATGRAAGERAAFCLTASVGRSSEGNRVGNAWNTNYVPLAAHVPAIAHTLRAGGFDAGEDGTGRGTPLVAFSTKDHGADAGDMAPTLRAMGHSGSHANGGGQVGVAGFSGVRRLTPRECERLMGWPDDHTRWRVLPDGRTVEQADGPRYMQCGNGVVANVAEWIARRLVEAS